MKENTQILKNFWFWIFLVVVAGISFFYIRFDPSSGGRFDSAQVLRVVLDNGTPRTFEGSIDDGMTVLEALDAVSKAGNFDLRFVIDERGAFELFSIGKDLNIDGRIWNFYVNQKSVSASQIHKLVVKNGDTIEAKFVVKE